MSTHRLAVIDMDRCVGCQSCMFACNRRHGSGGLARTAIHISSVGGIERGFSVRVCRACRDPPCADACPNTALLKREGGGVKLNPKLCTGCKSCIDACLIQAVSWDTEKNLLIICIYCGICAKYCPYQVIELQDIKTVI
ncbi:MAG: 4Fe-4S binding protein [Methanospirillum sp.]|uniref:4Fe-4S binding protein n=1 Tax=Methanospirillum sp. TaxID=45200 RepID=UPI00236CC5BD|nr:4Fe-4S binding protein [Methanospirillum sp.]MDD1729918.1 4Fe-4S binding protein [Methanospirillum sp.]